MNIKKAHILLVEDSETHAALIRESLDSGSLPVKVTVARSLAEARARLHEFIPDLAIIDVLLPDGKGTELFPRDREEPAYPAIIMTGQGDVEMAVETMKAGAVDYVPKSSATLTDMPRIVERVLREWKHIAERKQAEQESFNRSDLIKANVRSVRSRCFARIILAHFRSLVLRDFLRSCLSGNH